MIDFEEEIERFKPSLDIEEVEDAIVKSDLTDMTDVMMGAATPFRPGSCSGRMNFIT